MTASQPDESSRNSFDSIPVRGRQFGRYELIQEIGTGGMGSVYLARATGPGGFHKWVAIKRVHRHLGKEEGFMQMFLDEARIAAAVQHSNVAQVFDLGEANGEYFLAMEYLHGEHLGVICTRQQQAVPPRIAAKIVALAAAGLHHAHEARDEHGEPLGLIHRDVSPQNIFLTYDGNVKVTDFGIARAEGRLTETRSGRLKGKAAYMAPEQAFGGKLDCRVDIFAIGVVLWELSVGTRLFQSESDAETIMKIANQEIPSPSEVVVGFPPELEAIIMKSLAHDPAERYATARELSTALEKFVASTGDPIGSGELADFINELCPQKRESREELLRSASTSLPDVSSRHRPIENDETTSPTAATMAATPRAHTGANDRTVPEGALVAPIADTSRSSRPWVAVAVGAVAVAGIVAWQLTSAQGGEIATLRINTGPPGATVIIDGRAVEGTTPVTVPGLTYGRHEVELRLDGHQSRTEGVRVDRPELDLYFSLPASTESQPRQDEPAAQLNSPPEDPAAENPRPEDPNSETEEITPERAAERNQAAHDPREELRTNETATLTVMSNPGGAEVFVGGRRIGQTPIRHTIPANRRIVVRVRAADGRTETQAVRGNPNQLVPAYFNFRD